MSISTAAHSIGAQLATPVVLRQDDLTPAEKAAQPWTGQDTRLILVAVAAIALIVVLIAWLKLHPFLALILGSAFLSIAGGVPVAAALTNFEQGVGDTLKVVGLLIALGAMLGKLLADSGGADRVVDTILRGRSAAAIPWLMALVAAIIGLPMFFEIGLVLLLPVIVLVAAKSRLPLMRVGIPALAGLSVLHGLIPPHPGPLIAIGALGAPLGTTLAFGLLAAIPTVIICGPVFSVLAAKWVPVGADSAPLFRADMQRASDGRTGSVTDGAGVGDPEAKRPPSFAVTLGTILFPIVLMLLKALADII